MPWPRGNVHYSTDARRAPAEAAVKSVATLLWNCSQPRSIFHYMYNHNMTRPRPPSSLVVACELCCKGSTQPSHNWRKGWLLCQVDVLPRVEITAIVTAVIVELSCNRLACTHIHVPTIMSTSLPVGHSTFHLASVSTSGMRANPRLASAVHRSTPSTLSIESSHP